METYKMNFAAKTLTITKAFADAAAADPNSAEYNLLMKFQQDIPGLIIERKTHKAPSKYKTKNGEVYSCNQYKNLTYKHMEAFISTLPNSKEVMEVYNYLRYGVGLVQASPYATVREWFIQQFPLYRKNPLFYMKNEVKIIDISKIVSGQKDA